MAKFPVFVIDVDESRTPLLFVAGTQEDLNVFLQEHAAMEPELGEVTVTESLFYDADGTRLMPAFEAGNSITIRAAPERISPFYLRRLATDGFLAIEQFALDEMNDDEWAAKLAGEFAGGGSNPGSARHRAWHRSHRIPLNRSHKRS